MTTFPLSPTAKLPSYEQINASIKSIDPKSMELAKGVLPGEETPETTSERFLGLYQGLRPLFVVLTTMVLFPKKWRAAISAFIAATDAAVSDFKAGKDL